MPRKKAPPPDPGKILSLLRRQGLYGSYGFDIRSSGLLNSAIFISEMLHDALGFDSRLVIVTDGNDVDREVTNFNPGVVIIEALWVTPEKMQELASLHPEVIWLMRNHSALPFLSQEGVAIEWMGKYSKIQNVILASNDTRTMREFEIMTKISGSYLPNYYPPEFHPRPGYKTDPDIVNIGCFGAIRPLKNQLIQAVSAIRYADMIGSELFFHINNSRIEGGGDPIMKNIQFLFDICSHRHHLVTYPWLNRQDFIDLMRTMDAHMQVSFSETFNIVSADAVMNGVPIVVSPAIRWAEQYYAADPTNHRDIAEVLFRAIQSPERNFRENKRRLREYDEMAIDQWDAELASLL